MHYVSMWHVIYYCPILTKIGIGGQSLVNVPNVTAIQMYPVVHDLKYADRLAGGRTDLRTYVRDLLCMRSPRGKIT